MAMPIRSRPEELWPEELGHEAVKRVKILRSSRERILRALHSFMGDVDPITTRIALPEEFGHEAVKRVKIFDLLEKESLRALHSFMAIRSDRGEKSSARKGFAMKQ